MSQFVSPAMQDYMDRVYIIDINVCLKCGCCEHRETQSGDVYYQTKTLGYCSSCVLWYERFCGMTVQPTWWRKIVANGVFYTADSPKCKGNGRILEWLILSDNGGRIMTNTLHFLGNVPDVWLHLFPNNARFINFTCDDEWYEGVGCD